jgi:predicted DNA-binding protein (MmcQ/YjbR family)
VLGGKLLIMNAESIRAYCMSFPRATENLQWGDDLCFKVGGKIFTIVSLDNPRLCFKCTPEMFGELIEREDIRPAPYVGRYKWVMLDRLDAVPPDELEDLIRQSYEMVAANMPKSRSRKPKRGKPKSGKPEKQKAASPTRTSRRETSRARTSKIKRRR